MKIIDMRKVIDIGGEGVAIVRKAMAEGNLPAKCDEAFSKFEAQALPFTEYNLSSKPHPDVAEAHFALWLAAAATAAHAGAMSRALYAVRMGMASGPVEDDYTLLAGIEDYAKAKVGGLSAAETVELPKMETVLKVVEDHLAHQAICTPAIDLREHPPIADTNEIHLRRCYGREMEAVDGTPVGQAIPVGPTTPDIDAKLSALEERMRDMLSRERDGSTETLERLKSLADTMEAIIASNDEVRKAVNGMAETLGRIKNQMNHK